MKNFFWSLFCGVIFLSLIGAGFFYIKVVKPYDQPIKVEKSKVILIPKGSSGHDIKTLLKHAGYDVPNLIFKLQLKLSGLEGKLQAGEYEIPAHSSLKTIFLLMASGKVVQHRITIPEGFQSREVMARLNANDKLSGPQIVTVQEGSILPESYDFPLGMLRADLLNRMEDAQKDLQKSLENHSFPAPLMTWEEVIILASIIEHETGIDSERPLVAGVFLNRLRLGMPLQSDPTVIFAIESEHGHELERDLYRKDLQIDSPYNTYKVKGLTPGPICNPGKASIMAVLNPQQSDFLYFISDGNGRHIFSKSYKEHQVHHNTLRALRKKHRKSQ